MAVTCCSSTRFEEAAVVQFENMSRIPSPSWARIRKGESNLEVFTVESVWNQRDLSKNGKRNFKKCSVMRCRLSEKDGVGEIESLGETYPSEMTNV